MKIRINKLNKQGEPISKYKAYMTTGGDNAGLDQ